MKIAPREKGETAMHFNSKSRKKLSKNDNLFLQTKEIRHQFAHFLHFQFLVM